LSCKTRSAWFVPTAASTAAQLDLGGATAMAVPRLGLIGPVELQPGRIGESRHKMIFPA